MKIRITGRFDITVEVPMGKPPEPPGQGGTPPGHGGTPPGQQPEPPDPGIPTPPDRPQPIPPEPPDIEEPPPDIEIEPPPVGSMQALVMLSGVNYVFNEADAIDIGSYVHPHGRFTMACRRGTLPSCPLRVDFRRIDGWQCIIFETGDPMAPEPLNLPPYEVQIVDDAGAFHPVQVPDQWAYSRWRWQSGKWPLELLTVEDLTTEGLVPNYDADMTGGTAHPLPLATYEPMGLAGLTANMPNTGGRSDIGLFTDWGGEYLCTQSETALASVLAQAEAGGTIPWMMRDLGTGAPLDLMNDWKYATIYWDPSANPYIPSAKDTGISIDTSHQPALAYLPLLLTGDPYHLETLQCQANFAFLETPRNWNEGQVWQCPGTGQTRSMAWNIRTIGSALAMTPEEVPSWLLPKAVLHQMLAQCVKGTNAIMQEGGNNRTVLHAIDVGLPGGDEGAPGGYYPSNCYSRCWQTSFFAQAVGWLAQLHRELAPLAGYIAKNMIARADGLHWDSTYPAPYALLLRPAYEADWFDSWQVCWESNAAILGVPAAPLSNQLKAVGDYEGGFYGGLAALAQGHAAGVSDIPAEINAALDHYSGQVAALLATGGNNYLTWNNAIALP